MNSWYIDSIDGRAGLAFTTRRDSDLTNTTSVLQEGLTAFISPPSFQPEFLECRSPGLALGRGHGQLGLFLHQEEVPFDNLEAVSEFVRRVYIRGSTGDGPGEGGGEGIAPPPSAEGPPPSAPQISDESASEGGDPIHVILAFTAEMNDISRKLSLGSSRELKSLPCVEAASINKDILTEQLSRAAFLLILQATQGKLVYNSIKLEGIFQCLFRIFARIGLWPLLWEATSNKSKFKKWLDRNSAVLNWMRYQCDNPHYYTRGCHFGYHEWSARDPFDDLAHLPIPKISSQTGEDFSTMQALLGLLCSTPADLLSSTSSRNKQNAELALLAATYLTVEQEYAPTDGYFYSLNISQDFLAERVAKAMSWLSLNFPRRVYVKELEITICAASQLDRNGPRPTIKPHRAQQSL